MNELADEIPGALRSPVRFLVSITNVFISISALIMAATFFFVVVFRYVLKTDLFAYEEWLMVIVFWLYMLAGAMGTYYNTHIVADLLDYTIKDARTQRFKDMVVISIETLISLVFVYWGVLMMLEELSAYPSWKTTIALKIPFFVPRLGIFIGFTLMSIYSLLRLYVTFTKPLPPRTQREPGRLKTGNE